MRCESYQNLILEAIYGELSDRRHELEQHLDQCADCKQVYTEMKAALELMDQNPEPMPPTPDIWSKLEPQLDEVDRPKTRWISVPRVLSLAAVFLLGFLIVTWKAPPPVEKMVQIETKPQPQTLTPFLERTQPLLLSLANRQPDEPSPGRVKQELKLAAELAEEAAQLRITLKDQGAKRSEIRLARDLERILLQTANMEKRKYRKSLGLLQDQIEDRDLLFRITLLQMRSNRVASL